MYILQENNEIKTFFKESENAITEESKKVEARVVKALQGIGKQNFRNEIVDTL